MYPIFAILLPPLVPLLMCKGLYFISNLFFYALAWLTLLLFFPASILFYAVCVVHAFSIIRVEKEEEHMRKIRQAIASNRF